MNDLVDIKLRPDCPLAQVMGRFEAKAQKYGHLLENNPASDAAVQSAYRAMRSARAHVLEVIWKQLHDMGDAFSYTELPDIPAKAYEIMGAVSDE